jgi:hypothetical protein
MNSAILRDSDRDISIYLGNEIFECNDSFLDVAAKAVVDRQLRVMIEKLRPKSWPLGFVALRAVKDANFVMANTNERNRPRATLRFRKAQELDVASRNL